MLRFSGYFIGYEDLLKFLDFRVGIRVIFRKSFFGSDEWGGRD